MEAPAEFPVSVALRGGRRQEVRVSRSTTWDQFRQKVRERFPAAAGLFAGLVPRSESVCGEKERRVLPVRW